MIREPMMILRKLWTRDVQDPEVKTTYQYVVILSKGLMKLVNLLRSSSERRKRDKLDNTTRNVRDRTMEPGQKVLVLLPTKRSKLLMQWRGPYIIEERKSSMDNRINIDGKSKTLHANLLRLYVDRENTSSAISDVHSGALSVVCSTVVQDEDEDEDLDDERLPLMIETVPNIMRTESVDDVSVSELLSEEQKW